MWDTEANENRASSTAFLAPSSGGGVLPHHSYISGHRRALAASGLARETGVGFESWFA